MATYAVKMNPELLQYVPITIVTSELCYSTIMADVHPILEKFHVVLLLENFHTKFHPLFLS